MHPFRAARLPNERRKQALSTAACAICGRPAARNSRYCDTCDFQSRPAQVADDPVHVAKVRAASGNRFAEVRIFLGVFVVAAITTTVLGMGGPLGFPALRASLGLEPAEQMVDAGDWGEVRWVHTTSRVRAGRSTDTEVVGRLKPGDSVRVDFAGAGWYAVFPTSASDRSEESALGYVYGKLLKKDPPPDVKVPLVRILP